jgi:hypothetical protein
MYSKFSPYANENTGTLAKVAMYQIFFTYFSSLIIRDSLLGSGMDGFVGGCMVVINTASVVIAIVFEIQENMEALKEEEEARKLEEAEFIGSPSFDGTEMTAVGDAKKSNLQANQKTASLSSERDKNSDRIEAAASRKPFQESTIKPADQSKVANPESAAGQPHSVAISNRPTITKGSVVPNSTVVNPLSLSRSSISSRLSNAVDSDDEEDD